MLHQRACLSDAAGDEVRLDREFLLGKETDFGLEFTVAGQGNLDTVGPRADEHRPSNSPEFANGADKSVVEENGSAVGSDLEFDFRIDLGILNARVSLQSDMEDEPLAGLDGDLLGQVGVSRLPQRDFVCARQEQEFLVVFQLPDVTDILPVDPDARVFLNFGGGVEGQLAENPALRVGPGRCGQQRA